MTDYSNDDIGLLPSGESGGYGAGEYGDGPYGDPSDGSAPPLPSEPVPEPEPPMNYDVVQARGQIINLSAGQRYENKLIDCTTGGAFRILVNGGGVTIRNLGFKGLYRGDSFQIILNMTSRTSEPVLIENVYLGDGATKEGTDFVHGPGGIFYHKNADGDVTFRHINVQGYPNNGFYCANSGSSKLRWENCSGKNNGVTTYRGSAGDRIVNSVAYNDRTTYGPGYGGYVETNGRCVWSWYSGTMTAEECHFDAGPDYSSALVAQSGTKIDMRSGQVKGGRHGSGTISVASGVGSNPSHALPPGVPDSAEAAAAGETSIPGPKPSPEPENPGEFDDLRYVYEFVATDGHADYYFEIEPGSEIRRSSYNDAATSHDLTWISADGTKAVGRVPAGQRHAFEFDSLLVDAGVDPAENVDVFINGGPSHLSRYPLEGASGGEWMRGFPWQRDASGDEVGLLRARVAELEGELAATNEDLTRAKQNEAMLQQQLDDAHEALAEYDDRFAKMREAVEAGERNVPLLGSMFRYLKRLAAPTARDEPGSEL